MFSILFIFLHFVLYVLIILCDDMVNRFKKPMGLWVWVLYTQTHAHKPAGSTFCPINKPPGSEVDPYPYPNGAKTHRVSDLGYLLPSLIWSSHVSFSFFFHLELDREKASQS